MCAYVSTCVRVYVCMNSLCLHRKTKQIGGDKKREKVRDRDSEMRKNERKRECETAKRKTERQRKRDRKTGKRQEVGSSELQRLLQ